MVSRASRRVSAIQGKVHEAVRQAIRDWPYILFPATFLVGAYLVGLLAGPEAVHRATREDGLVEWLGTLAFLGASVAFGVAYWRSGAARPPGRRRAGRNPFLLLLAVLCFFAFGEEIAWGQRMLNFAVPEFFAERNIQQDTTIHNLDIFVGGRDRVKETLLERVLNVNSAFNLFWIAFFVVVPVSAVLSRIVHRRLTAWGLLVVPAGVGLLFPFNYVVSKLAERATPLTYRDGITEMKEALFAFLFLVLAVHQVIQVLAARRATVEDPLRPPAPEGAAGARPPRALALDRKDGGPG